MLAESYLTRTRLLLEDQSTTTMRCGQKCGNWLKFPGQEIRTRKVHGIAALCYGPSRSRRGHGPLCGCNWDFIVAVNLVEYLKYYYPGQVQWQLPDSVHRTPSILHQ